jgi:gamma-glutamylcyclotransferase (GGCT)/AIG2-like uncharacterized protein YtfP
MDSWYFAYGSNLLRDQMIARTGAVRGGDDGPRIVSLPNHRVAFNVLGSNGQIYANIVESGEGVLGVVYRCSEESLVKLDGYEGGYDRREVIVIDDDGQELTAVAYIARPECLTFESRPSAAYLRKIVTGAREHGLPEEYIETLQSRAQE